MWLIWRLPLFPLAAIWRSSFTRRPPPPQPRLQLLPLVRGLVTPQPGSGMMVVVVVGFLPSAGVAVEAVAGFAKVVMAVAVVVAVAAPVTAPAVVVAAGATVVTSKLARVRRRALKA